MRLPLALAIAPLLACATPAATRADPAATQAEAGVVHPDALHPRSTIDAGESGSAAFVASLREEYRALGHIQKVLGWYESTQGEKQLGQLTYLGHGRLFGRAALDAVSVVQEQGGLAPNDALALRFFRRALTSEVVTLATVKLDDAFSAAEANATVVLPWLPKPLAYRDVGNTIALEPDAARRAQIFAATTAVIEEKLNPILEEREAAAQKAARETGFADYVALSEDLRSVKLSDLLAEGVRYVQATDSLYLQVLDRVAREELGIAREKLRLADNARLARAPKLAQHFEKTLELKALLNFLSGIGLDLHTAANTEVQIDDSLFPKKVPRAFVNPVDAPGDVRLSVKPVGGLNDYWTLFHEAGHAVHFANATIEPKELVNLGHGAPSEAFGEFFRQAFSDPRWLVRYRAFLVAQGKPAPSNAELAGVLRRTALGEMMYLRRYCFAKIAYELRLHGRPESEIAPALALLPEKPASLRDLYRALFSRAYGFELNDAEAQRYRIDVDDTFYAADYARCFALAGMMHEGIRRRFGEDWYGNRDVGRFLKTELFAPGTSLSPEEVAAKLGFAPTIDFALSAQRAARLVTEADALEKSK